MIYYGYPVWAALMGSAFVGGFTGALLATGSLSAALTAGLTSAAFAGLAYIASPYVAAIAKVAVGCSGHSGGNCGRLAEAEAFSLYVGSPSGGGGQTGVWGTTLSTVEAGAVGGIASKIAGGSFNNGFSNAAGAYLGADIAGEIVTPQNQSQGLNAKTRNDYGGGSTRDTPSVITELRNDPSSGFAAAEGAIQQYSDSTGNEGAFVFYRNSDGSYTASYYFSPFADKTLLPMKYNDWGIPEYDLDVPGSALIAIEHTHPGAIGSFSGNLEGPSFGDATVANQFPNSYMIINEKFSGGAHAYIYYGPSVGLAYSTDWQ
jgi:hypothetical protein